MSDLAKIFSVMAHAIKDTGVSAMDLSDTFKRIRNHAKNTSRFPEQCPNCMDYTTWNIDLQQQLVRCNICNWRFDLWALENNNFDTLRNQTLEYNLRSAQREMQEMRTFRNGETFSIESSYNTNSDGAEPSRIIVDDVEEDLPPHLHSILTMSPQARVIRAQQLATKHSSLTPDELDELSFIARVASNEHVGVVHREGSFSRMPESPPTQTSTWPEIRNIKLNKEEIRAAIEDMEERMKQLSDWEIKLKKEKLQPPKPLKRKLDL